MGQLLPKASRIHTHSVICTELYVWCKQENVKPKKIHDDVARVYMSKKSKDLQPNIYNYYDLKYVVVGPRFGGFFPKLLGNIIARIPVLTKNSRAHILLTLETQ